MMWVSYKFLDTHIFIEGCTTKAYLDLQTPQKRCLLKRKQTFRGGA